MKELKGYSRGVNLGGWLSQGPKDKEHLNSFITEKDIKEIASWGADHIRLPLDYEIIENEDGSERPEGYVYIDSCISWCRKYNLKMVLDLHKTYGYIFDDPVYSADFFHNADHQARFLNLWERIIRRYAKDDDIIMFELLNEVVSGDVIKEWNELAAKGIAVIRNHTKTAKILYGGVYNNAITTVRYLDPPADENIVYNFHCYEPLIFTHQSAYWVVDMPNDFHLNYPGTIEDYREKSESITGTKNGCLVDSTLHFETLGPEFFEELFKDALEIAKQRDVALYCGEYGVIDQAPALDTAKWFRDINSTFNKYGIGRAVWNYKEKDFGLIGPHYDGIRDELNQSIFG